MQKTKKEKILEQLEETKAEIQYLYKRGSNCEKTNKKYHKILKELETLKD